MPHTPGPWIACDGASVSIDDEIHVVPDHVKRRFVREDGCRVTQFICDCNTLLPEHAENARLIAAAPALVNALHDLIVRLVASPIHLSSDRQITATIDHALLTLASARGTPVNMKLASATGHLVAAAPDLLKVAEGILEYWEETGFADCAEGCTCIVDELRRVIAKAEGR